MKEEIERQRAQIATQQEEIDEQRKDLTMLLEAVEKLQSRASAAEEVTMTTGTSKIESSESDVDTDFRTGGTGRSNPTAAWGSAEYSRVQIHCPWKHDYTRVERYWFQHRRRKGGARKGFNLKDEIVLQKDPTAVTVLAAIHGSISEWKIDTKAEH